MRTRSWRARAVGVLVAGSAALIGSLVADTSGASAADMWVVTLGDSAISGEAGRWAGNTNQSSSKTDTGANAYYDNAAGTAETIAKCHRSKAAEAHIGNGVRSLNLACSGARTYTQTGSNFKPGLDWYNGSAGKSQVVQLQEFAASHDVRAVTVLIGANNYGFADIVQQCVTNWLLSPTWWKDYCYDDSSIKSRFTASAIKSFGVLDAMRLLGLPAKGLAAQRDVPLLLQVGSDDSLGGEPSVAKLAAAYATRSGFTDVTAIVYPDARHEIYNETNRQEVIADLVGWLDARLPQGA